MPTYKIPLVGRFFGDSGEQSSQANTFYTNLKKINAHEAEVKGRRKAGEPTAEYVRENPEARLIMPANAAERRVSELRRHKRELAEKDAAPERIKMIDAQITQQMLSFNDRVRQAAQ